MKIIASGRIPFSLSFFHSLCLCFRTITLCSVDIVTLSDMMMIRILKATRNFSNWRQLCQPVNSTEANVKKAAHACRVCNVAQRFVTIEGVAWLGDCRFTAIVCNDGRGESSVSCQLQQS